MHKTAQNYEEACLDMAVEFVNGYYDDREGDFAIVESADEVLERFVGQDPTDILELSDMWLNIDDIYDFYRYGATYDQFVDWYWETVEKGLKMNLKHYLKLEKQS